MKIKSAIILAACGISLLSFNYPLAATITKPHTFTAGTPAKAEEVNENFDTVYDQVNKVGEVITVDQTSENVGIGETSPNSALQVNGPISSKITTVTTSPYSITNNDSIIICSSENEGITVNLPSATGVVGRKYTIIRNGSKFVQILGGSRPYYLLPKGSIEFVSDGSGWHAIRGETAVSPSSTLFYYNVYDTDDQYLGIIEKSQGPICDSGTCEIYNPFMDISFTLGNGNIIIITGISYAQEGWLYYTSSDCTGDRLVNNCDYTSEYNCSLNYIYERTDWSPKLLVKEGSQYGTYTFHEAIVEAYSRRDIWWFSDCEAIQSPNLVRQLVPVFKPIEIPFTLPVNTPLRYELINY